MDISDLLETVIFKKRRTPIFIHGSSERQCELAFPKHVIDYIIKNPKSPKQWKKLIQTCKLFFDKNPIVVIPCLHFSGWRGTEWKTCSSGICDNRHDSLLNFVDKPIKLWITENLDVDASRLNTAPLSTKLIPQLFKCDATKFNLSSDLLNIDDLKFLTANAIEISICHIRNTEKQFVVEEIIECLPASLESVTYHLMNADVTSVTFEKLAKMEHVQKLKKMVLHGIILPAFDFNALCKFVFENKQIYFEIDFSEISTSEEYLAGVIESTEKFRNVDYGIHRRPWICFNGILLHESN